MDRREALLLVERLKRRTRDPDVLALCGLLRAEACRREARSRGPRFALHEIKHDGFRMGRSSTCTGPG
jgi:hypothetical protein